MALPTCATTTGCLLDPPAITTASCAASIIDGEITDLFITDTALTAADGSTLAGLINNAGGTGNVIQWKVTGTLNEAEQGSFQTESGTQFSSTKTMSITAESSNMTSANWLAMRDFQCNKPVIVYAKVGSWLLGGEENWEDGIQTVIRAIPIGEGRDSQLKIKIDFSWRAMYSPLQITSPV